MNFLADLNSSKILVYAFLGGEVVFDGGAELQEIAEIDAAEFGRVILFFLFCFVSTIASLGASFAFLEEAPTSK